jgi:hypothetical protein
LTSEERILEEISKYKFEAKPIKKGLFVKGKILRSRNKEEREDKLSEKTFSTIIQKINLQINCRESFETLVNKDENSVKKANKFKAKPVPSFPKLEFEKSQKALTIPISPKVGTKSKRK